MRKYPSKVKVGRFNETQLRNKEDKVAVEKSKVETGYKYVITRVGKSYIDIYLVSDEEYYKTSKI